MTDILIKKFDMTEDLIKQNPTNENKIINEFNNFIINDKLNNQSYNKSMVRSATFTDDNPIDIVIHNNFQRYNDYNNDYNDNNDYNNKNDYNPTPINDILNTSSNSSNIEKFSDYFKDLRYGFKDYYPFNY